MTTPCLYPFEDNQTPCPHPVHGEGDRCIWHNPRIGKGDRYVAALLQQALESTNGDGRSFHLVGLIWPEANLTGVNFANADLRDATLTGSLCRGMNLAGANLRRANLSGADLRDVDLSGADLTGAHLTGTDLRNANLANATIDGAVLLGADLRKADLSGATIASFTWNRLTRFAGVKGLEPSVEDGDDGATKAFPAPMASGEDISRSHVGSLGHIDEDLDRTRVYQRPEAVVAQPGTGQPGTALQPNTQPISIPAEGEPGALEPRTARDIRLLRRHNRVLVFLVLVTLIWATAGSGLSLYLINNPNLLNGEQGRNPEPLVQNPPAVTLDRNERSSDYYRQANTKLRQRIQTHKEENRRLTEVSQRFSEERTRLQLEVSRLRGMQDDKERVALKLADTEAEVGRLTTANGRLRDTAAILAAGVEKLQGEVGTLRMRNAEKFTQLEKADRLLRDNAKLSDNLARRDAELEQAVVARESMQRQLQEANANLQRFLTRIEGTRLEDLMQSNGDRGPLVQLQPGHPVALGGGGVLITMRVEQGEKDNEVRTHLVVQRGDRRPLPDVSLVLYDPDGRPLRRLSHSFPEASLQPGIGRFATSTTTFTSAVFPASARLTAAPGIDEHLTASNGTRPSTIP